MADWAHMSGATVRSPCKFQATPKSKARRAKGGYETTIRNAAGDLTDAEAMVTFLRPWFEITRCTGSFVLFASVWTLVFGELRARWGDSGFKVCKQLQDHYFDKVAATEAATRYSDWSWIGSESGFAWVAGFARVQPGSAAGSQSQEAWHRRGFKDYVRTVRQPVPEFVDSLQDMCISALEDMQEKPNMKFTDLPQEPWPDRMLLTGGQAVFSRGRSCAQTFVSKKNFAKWHDESDGTTYYAMR